MSAVFAHGQPNRQSRWARLGPLRGSGFATAGREIDGRFGSRSDLPGSERPRTHLPDCRI